MVYLATALDYAAPHIPNGPLNSIICWVMPGDAGSEWPAIIHSRCFCSGGAYGEGRWALLDHDLSTVIFDESGRRLLGIAEVQKDVDRWINRSYKPDRQRGWLVCGLHPSDGNTYRKYAAAEYLAGYAGPPPMLRLRRGVSGCAVILQPGLDDGKTFVFWGRNYNT